MAYTPIIDLRDKDIVKIIELNDEEINFARKYNLSSSEVLHLKKYKIYNMEWLSILETIDYRFIGFIRDTYFSIYEDLKYKHVRNIENSVIYLFLNSIDYVKVKERFDKDNIQISVDTLLEYLNEKFKEEKLDEKIKELVDSYRLSEK